MKVLISNLDKAIVLMALYNASSVRGNGFLSNEGYTTMEAEQASKLLEDDDKYFDYINGKVMKVDMGGDILDLCLYDHNNGDGAGLHAIQKHYSSAIELTPELEQAYIRTKRGKTTIRVTMSNNIGQVRESKAQSEINRLNKQENTTEWKKSYADFLYCIDETDDNVNNPCKRSTGYVWIVRTKNKKQKAKIEYHKGYFTVNGEVRTRTNNGNHVKNAIKK